MARINAVSTTRGRTARRKLSLVYYLLYIASLTKAIRCSPTSTLTYHLNGLGKNTQLLLRPESILEQAHITLSFHCACSSEDAKLTLNLADKNSKAC